MNTVKYLGTNLPNLDWQSLRGNILMRILLKPTSTINYNEFI
jgi:hypothetical protein